MRARNLNKDAVAALVILAVVAVGIESVRAGGQQPGEKIEFSEVPGPSPVVVSNLNKVAPSESSFNQVKEDLLRPFSSLDPRNSLPIETTIGGTLPVPQRPAQAPMSKRTLDLLDKRRNWAFSTYEELYAPQDQVARQMFGIKEYGDDGREKKATSVVDRYYESMDGKNLSPTNQSLEQARAEFINQNGFDPLGKSFHTIDTLKGAALLGESTNQVSDKEDNPGQAGAAGAVVTVSSLPPELRRQSKGPSELYMLRRGILGDAAMPLDRRGEQTSLLLAPNDYYSPKTNIGAVNPLNQVFSGATAFKPVTANQLTVFDPTATALHSHINDDLTAKALGVSNPVGATNIYERPQPTAQSIQALQDPFGANRPKPRF